MKLSYNWLKELTGLDLSAEEMGNRLTLCGTACEYIEPTDKYMDKVIVGEIEAINPIEGADKIRLATVSFGGESKDVVCGAPNIEVGQKVPVATLGAKLAGGIEIKKAKIRGIESTAMICSERELGISDDHSGIMVLDSDAIPGTPVAEVLDFKDQVMTFELTPNRADSMSAIGIARDLGALASVKVKKPVLKLKETGDKASDYIKVTIDDTHGCPRYAARVIKNITVGESPWWLKKKLILSGMRPISNVVDITNLVMLETGHPLHAFDLDRFGSSEVVVRKAHDGENFKTLDGAEHTLTPEVLMITNGKSGVAAGGVMGGFDSEVEEDTKNILLEAAYFNPSVIRRSRKKLGMVSESSQRFEKGADPNGVEYAINYAAYLFQELCGGEILKGIVDCYPDKIEPAKISFRPKRNNDIIGIEVPTDRMKEIFSYLEFEVDDKSDNWEVVVPTFRPDLEREVDLIEEIARIVGYDNIPDADTNIGSLYTPTHYEERFRRELRTVLTASGFDEMYNHGLADSKQASLLYPDIPQIKIINPVSEDLDIMRTTLIQSTLNVISYNISHRVLDLCLFEHGKVYQPPSKKTDWLEQENLVIAVTGETEHTWRDRPRPFDIYDITGVLGNLESHFDWDKISFTPKEIPFFETDNSFEVILGDRVIGIIGQVKADVARKFEIKQPVTVAELNAEMLLEASGSLKKFKPLPKYPAALRDIAMVVSDDVNVGDLVTSVKNSGGEIVDTVEIFDLYKGKQIEKGKKSVALAINYRSLEGSLSNTQVEEAQQKVISKLKKEFNAEIRDK